VSLSQVIFFDDVVDTGKKLVADVVDTKSKEQKLDISVIFVNIASDDSAKTMNR